MTQRNDSSERNLVSEGTLDAVKIGAGETYLSAFGVFLGGTPLQIGALATLPPLVGAISQVFGMRSAEKVESRRSLIASLIKAQSVVWLPIASLPFIFGQGWMAVGALLCLVTLYHVMVGMNAPLWNSLVGDIVPAAVRGSFFGHRNRWIAVASFASLITAGSVVHLFTSYHLEAFAFAAIFLCAGVARALSARFLNRVDDPRLVVPEGAKFTFWQFLRRARSSNFVRFVIFVSMVNFGAAISGPYFAMYMLKDLKFSYLQYTGVICSAVVAQFVVMRSWGVFSDQFGNRRILSLCSWFVAVNPLLWLISSNYLFILAIQFYSGFFWSGFNIAAANFVFDAVQPEKRARCMAYQGIINGVLVCVGGLIGGGLSTYVIPHIGLHAGWWVPASPFLGLFFFSGIFRLLVVTLLLRTFKEVRQVTGIAGHHLLIRIVSIRPFWGATYSFVSGTYSVITNRARRGRRGRGDDAQQ